MHIKRRKAAILATAFIAAVAMFAPLRGQGFAAGLSGGSLFRFERAPSYTLAFFNTHTREDLSVTYRQRDRYDDAALDDVSRFLRDHRNGHVHEIDAGLLDLLHDLKTALEKNHPGLSVRYQVISGYRSSESNEMLRRAGGGQAKQSQHIEGRAIDVRVAGVPLKELRDTAWCLQRGGVGYYGGSDFIHVDTGRVRYWNWNPHREKISCGDGIRG